MAEDDTKVLLAVGALGLGGLVAYYLLKKEEEEPPPELDKEITSVRYE